eukprot:TRINITY_DN67179_c7_g2_i1.p1 TRINITY_DN67179_c7_g2~~TRINITY_DN67179_c7_g2_i1.p1  ORF type:complete len:818 (+),score=58.75 TRINITY_DN67179_c7_g2_i1:85-2538(+)
MRVFLLIQICCFWCFLPCNSEQQSYALSLTGNKGEYVTIKNKPELQIGTQNFSVEFWILTNGWPALEDPPIISNKDWEKGEHAGWIIFGYDDGEHIGANVGDSLCKSCRADVNTKGTQPPVSDGRWHHIAVTVDRNGDMVLYQDGNEASREAANNIQDIDNNRDFPLVVGQDGTLEYPYMMKATIDEIRLWSTALTQEEIVANMNNVLRGTSWINGASLVGYWPIASPEDDKGTTEWVLDYGSAHAWGSVHTNGDSETTISWVAGQPNLIFPPDTLTLSLTQSQDLSLTETLSSSFSESLSIPEEFTETLSLTPTRTRSIPLTPTATPTTTPTATPTVTPTPTPTTTATATATYTFPNAQRGDWRSPPLAFFLTTFSPNVIAETISRVVGSIAEDQVHILSISDEPSSWLWEGGPVFLIQPEPEPESQTQTNPTTSNNQTETDTPSSERTSESPQTPPKAVDIYLPTRYEQFTEDFLSIIQGRNDSTTTPVSMVTVRLEGIRQTQWPVWEQRLRLALQEDSDAPTPWREFLTMEGPFLIGQETTRYVCTDEEAVECNFRGCSTDTSNANVGCQCWASLYIGYWSKETNCTECTLGFHGSQCTDTDGAMVLTFDPDFRSWNTDAEDNLKESLVSLICTTSEGAQTKEDGSFILVGDSEQTNSDSVNDTLPVSAEEACSLETNNLNVLYARMDSSTLELVLGFNIIGFPTAELQEAVGKFVGLTENALAIQVLLDMGATSLSIEYPVFNQSVFVNMTSWSPGVPDDDGGSNKALWWLLLLATLPVGGGVGFFVYRKRKSNAVDPLTDLGQSPPSGEGNA